MGLFKDMINKRALAVATSSKEESTPEKQERLAMKKEKALTRLIGFNENTLKADNSVDRFWIEHGYPFMTTHHYVEGFESLQDIADDNGTLILDIYVETHEQLHTVNNRESDIWAIRSTGDMIKKICETYETIIIRIENLYLINIDTNDLIVERNEEYDDENEVSYKNSLEIPMDLIVEIFEDILIMD